MKRALVRTALSYSALLTAPPERTCSITSGDKSANCVHAPSRCSISAWSGWPANTVLLPGLSCAEVVERGQEHAGHLSKELLKEASPLSRAISACASDRARLSGDQSGPPNGSGSAGGVVFRHQCSAGGRKRGQPLCCLRGFHRRWDCRSAALFILARKPRRRQRHSPRCFSGLDLRRDRPAPAAGSSTAGSMRACRRLQGGPELSPQVPDVFKIGR